MLAATIENNFESWRAKARDLLATDVSPTDVIWTDDAQNTLALSNLNFTADSPVTSDRQGDHHAKSVPKKFIELCKLASCHRDPEKWPLMYRVLWRLTHREPNVLKIAVDPDVQMLATMESAVRRDRHKMTAFVRFRKVHDDLGERFVAWYEPAHFVLRLAVPHFKNRYAAMRWTILTPDESAMWDVEKMVFGPGVPRRLAPKEDELEELWKTYYANIYNPNRTSFATMRSQMPARYWHTMPETELIPGLLKSAATRAAKMTTSASSTQDVSTMIRSRSWSLPQLHDAAKTCTACELHCNATQTVFGQGPADARIVFVGEQPGDQEDLAGRPFVGPAGQLFDEMLGAVGIDRREIYVTNVVKHFKFTPRGKRRIHAKPNSRDIAACSPWLFEELRIVKPAVLVCLGSTAARAVIGPAISITRERGQWRETPWCSKTIATFHPSALLRVPDVDLARQMREQFMADLRVAAAAVIKKSP